MKSAPASAVSNRQLDPTVIVTCIRWYPRFSRSLRHVEELIAERNLALDRTLVWRWIQAYGPELRKRSQLKYKRATWFMDETYVRVAGPCTYLLRAVDDGGATVDSTCLKREIVMRRSDSSRLRLAIPTAGHCELCLWTKRNRNKASADRWCLVLLRHSRIIISSCKARGNAHFAEVKYCGAFGMSGALSGSVTLQSPLHFSVFGVSVYIASTALEPADHCRRLCTLRTTLALTPAFIHIGRHFIAP
jgi:hypothetical protein